MNLVGALERLFFEIRNSFQKRQEKPKKKKLRKNGNFYAKPPVFDQVDFFIWLGKKLTFSNSFQKNREKQKKNDEKTGIFTQNQFSTKSIFFMVVIQKLIADNT
ncbi:Uncharacterized protein FWK35_00020926 [Aphis craccivora]|uniref:Uncharacterized protein n=1 Tax=Aphis craccivora TaxID=307492 RepID=A0A6G0Y446_APHCR|nr:Uncharacterized protein FWK35_00020926 [Aphis craccivora]